MAPVSFLVLSRRNKFKALLLYRNGFKFMPNLVHQVNKRFKANAQWIKMKLNWKDCARCICTLWERIKEH